MPEYSLCIIKKNIEKIHGFSNHPKEYIFVSRNERLAEQAYKLWVGNEPKKLGKMLGYPDCCVDFYIKNYLKEKIPTPKDLLSKSKKPSFYTNNIFNFSSRLSLKGGEIEIFSKNKSIFENHRTYILSHMYHVLMIAMIA